MLALRSHLVVHVKPYSLSFVATPFPSQLIICPLFDVNVLLLRTYKGTDFERNREWLSEDVYRFNKLTAELQFSISGIGPQWNTWGSSRRAHRVFYVEFP